MWKTYAILSALFAALTAIFAKLGLKNINADLATAVRTVIILFMSWGIVLYQGKIKDIELFSFSNWFYLALSGTATGLSWLFYYRALQEGNTTAVAALDKSSLLLVMLLSFLLLNEPFSLKAALGCLLILAGTLVLIW